MERERERERDSGFLRQSRSCTAILWFVASVTQEMISSRHLSVLKMFELRGSLMRGGQISTELHVLENKTKKSLCLVFTVRRFFLSAVAPT